MVIDFNIFLKKEYLYKKELYMLTEKQILKFITSKRFKKVIKEVSSTSIASNGEVDDGRIGPWYANTTNYKKGVLPKIENSGLQVLNYLIGDEKNVGKDYESVIGYIFPAGDTNEQPSTKHMNAYKSLMRNLALRMGLEVLDFLDN